MGLEFYYRAPIPIPFSIFYHLFYLIYSPIRHHLNRKKKIPFETTPLNINIKEPSTSNDAKDKAEGLSDNVASNEKGYSKLQNPMEIWLNHVTEWEKAIHYAIQQRE